MRKGDDVRGVGPEGEVALGLRANWRQFALLVAVNVSAGGMVGLERSVLPVLEVQEFAITTTTAAASFIVSRGAGQGCFQPWSCYLGPSAQNYENPP